MARHNGILVGGTPGLQNLAGPRGRYAGGFINLELNIQGELSSHVVKKLLPMAKSRLKS